MSPRKRNNPIRGFFKMGQKATEKFAEDLFDAVRNDGDDKNKSEREDWTTGSRKPPPKRR